MKIAIAMNWIVAPAHTKEWKTSGKPKTAGRGAGYRPESQDRVFD